MTSQSVVTADELVELVAGTLSYKDVLRVANAVKSDVALQAQLDGLEQLRSELIHAMAFDKRQVTVEAFAENIAQRVERTQAVREKAKTGSTFLSWLGNFFTLSSTPTRFAFGLVAIQAVGIAWLVSGALQTNDGSAASTRTSGPDAKQLGSAPANVTFSVSFDPATPESTVRGLLLELEAQIIAGPSQLGQYKIIVARSRSHLALLKLKEAVFVEQFIEITKDAEQPDARGEDKK